MQSYSCSLSDNRQINRIREIMSKNIEIECDVLRYLFKVVEKFEIFFQNKCKLRMKQCRYF